MKPLQFAFVGFVCCVLTLSSACAQGTTSPRLRNVVISEVYSSAYDPAAPLPSFIELFNRDVVLPAAIGGSTLVLTTATGTTRTFTFPAATIVGPGSTVILTAQRIQNAGVVGIAQFVDSQFFAGAVVSPTAAFSLCFFERDPAGPLVRIDAVPLNATAMVCSQGQWVGFPLDFRSGYVQRVLLVDSDTNHDWYSVAFPPQTPVPPVTRPSQPSPNTPNPEIARINGFRLGQSNADGIPLPVPALGPLTPNNVSIVSGTRNTATSAPFAVTSGEVRSILIPEHPDPAEREIRDGNFDACLRSGTVLTAGQFDGLDAVLANVSGRPLNWQLRVPPTSPTGNPGVLQIDMGPLSQANREFQLLSPVGAGRRLRVERILTDNSTDGTAMGSGELTEVMIEVLPDPGGPPGDVWCELIVYDPSGFRFVAKVKNWPANPLNCSSANFGMSSISTGRLDLVAICFNPMAELYIIPSLTTTGSVGTGAFLGVELDAFTMAFLGSPLGTDPAHVTTTVEGLYYYSTNIVPSGVTIDALAVEFTPGLGFTSLSPVRRISVL